MDYWHALLVEGIQAPASDARTAGLPLAVTECRAITDYKDCPLLPLDGVKYKINELVNQKAKKLEIDHLLDRLPKDVSGGQRQRVALGRAIVRDSSVFLMDAKMRVQMRSEIIRLHRELGATTVYVTHDQTEAMTMGDRIVVMNDGIMQQVGTPEEIYNEPANRYVAGFIGRPPMNFIPGRLEKTDTGYAFSKCITALLRFGVVYCQ